MRKRVHEATCVALTALALAVLARPSLADVVRMKSGDVITGKIEKVSDEELTIDPPFADAIEIKLKYIAVIETKRPVKVTFKDGRERTGFIELDPQGQMQVNVTPSRWDQKHADDSWRLGASKPPGPAPGTQEPLADVRTIQELEVAYYRYEADIGLGFNAASGNTESSALDLDASLEPTWGPNSLRLNGSIERRKSGGSLSAENWNVGLKYERDLPEKWFAGMIGTVESDPFQELNLRSTIMLGAGYRFYDADPTHLSVTFGPAYVREDFTAAGADREFAAVAWMFDFERELFSSDLTLYHSHRLIQSFTGAELLLKTTQGVKLDLWHDLDLKLEFDFDHTSDPAPGVTEKDDLRYIVKLDFEFEGDETDWFH